LDKTFAYMLVVGLTGCSDLAVRRECIWIKPLHTRWL
jgi:hypothetical protein